MMTRVVCILLILFGLGGIGCSTGVERGSPNERIMSAVHNLLLATQVNPKQVNSYFCTKLMKYQSGRLNYVGYKGADVGCSLPIALIQLDSPPADGGTDTFVTILLDQKSCMHQESFEKEFPGGNSSISTDSAAPQYSAEVGINIVGAKYDTLTSRYGCVSEIYLRIKHH